MADRAMGKQKEAVRRKSYGKRRLQRALSLSVLSDHLSVKVYDSHAYISSTSVRGNAQQIKPLRKHYSYGITSDLGSQDQLTLTDARHQRSETSVTDIPKTSFENVPSISNSIPYNSSLRLGHQSLQTGLNPHEKDTADNDKTLEINGTDSQSEYVCHQQHLSANAPVSTSISPAWQQMSTNCRKQYSVLGPIVEMNAEHVIDTVKIYKRHDNEARHKEKQISEIKFQAKLRISSNSNSVNIHGLKHGNQRPRKLLPLRKKPNLLEAKDAINDKRFQTLIQSLRKVHMNSKDAPKPDSNDNVLT